MNYYHNCREVTLEISNTKLLPENQLEIFWEYNYRSFLNYMEQTLFGIQGVITDSVNDNPIHATVSITDHDNNNSWVISNPVNGFYYRPIYSGNYELMFSAPGYIPKIVEDVQVTNGQTTQLDIQLVYNGAGVSDIINSKLFEIGPNPFNDRIFLSYQGHAKVDCNIDIYDIKGRRVHQLDCILSSDKNRLTIDFSAETSGYYLISIRSDHFQFSEKIIKK